jgi:hypothetical protein
MRHYYKMHRERLLQYSCKYYDKNKEEVKEYRKEKITCPHCEASITRNGLALHQKSKACRAKQPETKMT